MIEFLLTHGSYLGIIFVLILTGSGLPIPEEVPIIAAGLLSAHGQMDPWLAVGACLIGALLGDCVIYWVGHHFGRRVLREHHWWSRFVKPEREARIEAMLQEHGLKVFFLARFLVGIRSPVYLAAGILHVPFRRFLLIDLFCATTVIGTFFGLSYLCGPTVTSYVYDALELGTGIVVVVLAGVGIYFWRRHRRKVAEEALKPEPPVLDNVPVESSVLPETSPVDMPWQEAPDRDPQCVTTPDRHA